MKYFNSFFIEKVMLLSQPNCTEASGAVVYLDTVFPTSKPKKACTLFVLSRQSKQFVLTVPL